MLATVVTDYLVYKGALFQETHHISGRCVAKSGETRIPMNELSFEQLKAIDTRFKRDCRGVYVCDEHREEVSQGRYQQVIGAGANSGYQGTAERKQMQSMASG